MRYMLLCNNCGQKHFTNGTDLEGLVEVKSAPLPKHANGVSKDAFPLPRRFKCYICGHLFRVNELKPVSETQKEDKREEIPLEGEDYFKKWESEVLKSVRRKPDPGP